jgi:hypothetical protein
MNFADCNGDASDGCETDLSFSGNCGRCGHACNGAQFCGLGGCCENSLPAGSYLATCEGCSACEGVLQCLCKDVTQALQPTSIPLTPACPGEFINCDGVLKCTSC